MLTSNGKRFCAICLSVVVPALLGPGSAMAVDCNSNGVEDAQDISAATSQDCDLNGVPDECQPDSDTDGTIDACDTCGTQLTDNNSDEQWSIRQRSSSQGFVLWFDNQDDVYFYDGASAQLVQPRLENNVDLEAVANFVFTLGSGAAPGEVVGAWRRGTDFAWVWANDGQPPRPAVYTNPYDPTRIMNPEDVAVADGCVFILLQASDPATNNLIKLVYRIDPATGNSTLLTEDFLDDSQTGGTGGEVGTLVSSGCRAAWSWCGQGNAGTCTADLDLHFYDGTTTTVLDTNATALSFARGRLIYSKPIDGVTQLFLYDTNLSNPVPVQITSLLATDKQILYAQTDGRNVAMLVADAGGANREIVLLGGLPLTDAETRPTDTPPNLAAPFQLHRGQLLWTDFTTSVNYFDGENFGTVCSEGWLADGYVAQLRKSSTTGTDTEVFLFTGTPPDDAQQPSAPLLVKAIATGNPEATVSWSTVLGATSYNVYYAQQSGVTPANYQSLPGGGVAIGITGSPAVIGSLAGDQAYYFVVTVVEDGTEGPISSEASVPPCLDPTADGDSDGTPDCADGCPEDPAKNEPGACGCGIADTDTDGDGTPDCTDGCPEDANKTEAGACGCGVVDTDTDGDGTPDCTDGCTDDPAKTQPGECGCGVADTDTDGDGTPDCLEDGDGDGNGNGDGDGNGNGNGDGDGDGGGDGCAPGLCGPGVVPVVPIMLLGMGLLRRIWRRAAKPV